MDKYRDLLKVYWGYDDFRGIQREIVESIGRGRDTLGLMPTGGGKSVTFQVPALAMKGVCIVVTPLIALMKDQVEHLRQRGIKAAAIYSGMRRQDIIATLENCIFDAVKILYVSPERLESEIFLTKLRHIKVSFFTVDEAHCISQWGYDFRPSYLKIAAIRKLHPESPVLALTATATPAVVDDIQDKLQFREKNVLRMSFRRPNLSYVVRHTDDKLSEMVHILQSVQGCAIVYVSSRDKSRTISETLNGAGIKSTYYHAGLDAITRDRRQTMWQNDEVRVIVATNAFGMGIDKAQVRVVIHHDCPSTIEAYFQEAGRAGRDGQRAYAVLLYDKNDDRRLKKNLSDQFPQKEYIRKVYDHLAYFYQIGVGSGYDAFFNFDIDRFCQTFKHFPLQLVPALQILDMAGYIGFEPYREAQARVHFLRDRDDLYSLKGNTAFQDRLIETMLRTYSGMFSDYQYINEAELATKCEATVNDVYLTLKALGERRIIKFIPSTTSPTIHYRQRREDSEHIIIPRNVYEERLAIRQEALKAMLNYVHATDRCRSAIMLDYLGEPEAGDCGVCDVCLEKKRDGKASAERAIENIKAAFADGKRHTLDELSAINGFPKQVIRQATAKLVEDGTLQIDGITFEIT